MRPLADASQQTSPEEIIESILEGIGMGEIYTLVQPPRTCISILKKHLPLAQKAYLTSFLGLFRLAQDLGRVM
mgnify:FL=1